MVVNKSAPFDLDAYQAEGEDGPKPDFEFVFGGETYRLPPKANILALLDFDAGRIEAGLRRLLGGDQWARMNAADSVFDTDKLNGLLEAYQRHLGTAPGESLALPVSSKRTATRSKRTSNGTTKLR